MAWEALKTDYVDAVFDGLRKYTQVTNSDGTYSFVDVTTYTVKEGSFFGASDVNAINTAINAIMAALENGTDLYEVFTEFFENQQTLFEEAAQEYNVSFEEYLAALKETLEADCAQLQADYATEIEQFENTQETAFNTWFALIKDQLSSDAAGNLQNEINDITDQIAALEEENEELRTMLISGYIYALLVDSDEDTLCTSDGDELQADWYLATA